MLDPQEKILTVKNYANTGFVNIVLKKRFYIRVEKIAEEVGSKPDTIINNMLLLTMKKLQSVINILDRVPNQEISVALILCARLLLPRC